MPGIAHGVGANDDAIGHRLLNIGCAGLARAQTNRPQRAEILLSLDSAHPLDHLYGFFEWSRRNMLVVQSLMRNA